MKIIFFLLFLFLPSFAGATTYYVSSGGSAPPGTDPPVRLCSTATSISTPLLTINAAAQCLSPGDTLMIRGGTYNESLIRSNFEGRGGTGFAQNPADLYYTWGAIGTPTTIQAYNNETVTINGGIAWGSVGGTVIQYFLFKDLIFDCTVLGINSACLSFGGGFNGGTLSHIKFDNIEAKNTAGGLVTGDDGTGSHIWVTNSRFHDMGPCITNNGTNDSMHMVYLGGTSTPGSYGGYYIIEYTEIYNVPGSGIQSYTGFTDTIRGNVFRYNYIHDVGLNRSTNDPPNYTQCYYHVESGIEVHNDAGTTQIYGNLIINNQNGINVGATAAGDNIYNNTIWGNGVGFPKGGHGSTNPCCYAGITISAGTAAGAIKNNIVYGNAVAGILDTNYNTVTGANVSNNFTSDPAFINPNVPNCTGANCAGFHLQPGSSAINYGTASICAACGPGGTPVSITSYSGPLPDAGAYEFTVIAPTVVINSPVSTPTYTTGTATITLGGTATLQAGGSLSWTCNRCTQPSGTITGTTNWTSSVIGLLSGLNTIIVTVTDVNGSSTDQIAVTHVPIFPGNTLAGAWAFDEPSGISATDSSGNSNTGILVNAASRGVGKFGTAVLLDSTLTQSVNVSDSNSLDYTQSFTMSAWVFPTVVHNDFRTIVTKNSMIALYASNNGFGNCAVGTPMIFFITNGILGPSYFACSATTLPLNSWSHVAGTYDGSNLRLYVNGVEVAVTAATGYLEPSTGSLQIGTSSFGEYFDGLLDEVRTRNYAVNRTGGGNTTFGAVCNRADSVNVATASIIGDANCSIISPTPPAMIKLGASSNALKLGVGATILKHGATIP